MIDRLNRDEINRQQREAVKQAKWQEEIFRADVQHLLNDPAMRRVLWRYWQDMGLDVSPFATNAMAQSHAIGLQDAAKWWLNVIRAHCPEKEAQVRKEGLTVASPPPNEEEDDE